MKTVDRQMLRNSNLGELNASEFDFFHLVNLPIWCLE